MYAKNNERKKKFLKFYNKQKKKSQKYILEKYQKQPTLMESRISLIYF